RIVCGLLMVFSGFAFAEPEADGKASFATKQGLTWNGTVGVEFGEASNTNSDTLIGAMIGANGSYYFTPNVGAFLGAQYVSSRGFKILNQSKTTGYVDIPFGFVFNTGSQLFSGNSRTEFALGGFYAIAMGDLKGDLSTATFGPRGDDA